MRGKKKHLGEFFGNVWLRVGLWQQSLERVLHSEMSHCTCVIRRWRLCPSHQGNISVLFVFAHHLLIAFQLLLHQQKQTNRQSNTCNDATQCNTKVLQWIILTVWVPEAILWFYNYQLCLHIMAWGRRTEYSWTVWGRQWCITNFVNLSN